MFECSIFDLFFILKIPQGKSRGSPLWHADLGILDNLDELKRTRSDAMSTTGKSASHMKERADGFTTRPRSQSGDSAIFSRLIKLSPEPEGARDVGDGGVVKNGISRHGETTSTVREGRYVQFNGHTDMADAHRILKEGDARGLRRSRSYEDILDRSEEPDFCLLTYAEPEDVDTGGTYTMIFDDECEYISDEDDRSTEVRDLVPMYPAEQMEGVDSGRVASTSISLPKASKVLINAFQQRIESVMVNGVHYPPGLFFVQ